MTTFVPPAGACDTHVHVFRPDLYPYAGDRAYTPGRMTAGDLAAFLSAHGLDRVVLVQPSVCGTDNRALVDALAELGPRARGIAVIDPAAAGDSELADLDAAGVVGIRLNVATRDVGGLRSAIEQAAARLAGTAWLIQIHAPAALIKDAAGVLQQVRQPVVIDHFGSVRCGGSGLPDGVDVLIALARDGPAYIKLSAAHRVSDGRSEAWSDVAPLAQALVAAVPDRLIWGSDWPHTGQGRGTRAWDQLEPFQPIDDRLALEQLANWAGSAPMLQRILVETPARLYRFAATP